MRNQDPVEVFFGNYILVDNRLMFHNQELNLIFVVVFVFGDMNFLTFYKMSM